MFETILSESSSERAHTYHQQMTEEKPNRLRFLVVEDDVTMAPIIQQIIHRVDPEAEVIWATAEVDAEAALNRKVIDGEPIDVVITDVFLADRKTGLDLWRRYGKRGPQFLLISALSFPKFNHMLHPFETRPMFFTKPLDINRVADALKSALQRF
jgi:DNA-binding NtrC family response regulator